MLSLTKAEKAYIAGMLDSDGSIVLSSSGISKRGKIHKLTIAIGSASPTTTTWIAKKWGVNVYTRKPLKRAKKPHLLPHALQKKTMYICQLTGKKAASALEDVLPYLVRKEKQAKLAIKFAKTIGNYGEYLSKQVRLKRKKLVKEIQKYNQHPT